MLINYYNIYSVVSLFVIMYLRSHAGSFNTSVLNRYVNVNLIVAFDNPSSGTLKENPKGNGFIVDCWCITSNCF
ncbi:hypothetical protein [Bartonella sp. DGB1]|uniref:hypothetical protein n=1 Tax=Bartonella sp. DGB1 TaxID=3239807 RepID=UPI0035254C0C